VGDSLGRPGILILPKLFNVAAAIVVLCLLVLRWLPMATREREASVEDVRRTSAALSQEAEEHRRLFEASGDLIVVTDADRVITRISNSCDAILGYQPEEMIGRYDGEYIRSADIENLRMMIAQAAAGRVFSDIEVGFIHKSGRLVSTSLAAVWSPEAKRFFLIGRDVTEAKAAERRLEHLAHFDQLTGLPNRASLLRDLSELLAPTATLKPRPLAIAIFGLDDFKDINDTLGHATGDGVLKEVARRLSADAPGRVYRLGGDEFALLLPGRDDSIIASHFARTALNHVGERIDIDGHRLFIGASAGVAVAPADGAATDELLANVNLALRDAKAGGGRKSRVFLPEMRERTRARHQLESELRRAVSNKEYGLYFQPQMRLSDGAVVGAEALLRWRHPQRGLLEPPAFIAALGKSPAAMEAGEWALRKACATAASWTKQGLPPLRIGVNLFAAQFQDGHIVDAVEAVLRDSGLPPHLLELEITENVALGQDESILGVLGSLRAAGVGIALDDFGAGYASLSYLMRYPLTRIKIDKSFVQRVSGNSAPEDTAIVRSIIVMAHNLKLGVIAEGVETPLQAAFLRDNNCEEAQGYLYAKPLPADEFADFLAASPRRLAGKA
jgi:diguanylate cyclase (GGDEF)-like protein/PAS domain S-box-containing protein